jgi:anti-sigma factor RsiW
MTKDIQHKHKDARLWARARDGWRETMPPAPEPDPLVLAAYLDGSLDEAARAQVEAWMAGSPDALDLAMAARDALVAGPAPPPDSLIARASGLVRTQDSKGAGTSGGPSSWFAELFSPAAWTRPAGWAGSAAAILIACLIGFELGRAGSAQYGAGDIQLAEETGFEIGVEPEDFL